MTTPGALVCPKCKGHMTSYERNGIVIEQCADCRGIFLDRGELEHLINAEANHYQQSYQHRSDERRHEKHRDDDDDYEHGKKRHKRGGFLSDLFD